MEPEQARTGSVLPFYRPQFSGRYLQLVAKNVKFTSRLKIALVACDPVQSQFRSRFLDENLPWSGLWVLLVIYANPISSTTLPTLN